MTARNLVIACLMLASCHPAPEPIAGVGNTAPPPVAPPDAGNGSTEVCRQSGVRCTLPHCDYHHSDPSDPACRGRDLVIGRIIKIDVANVQSEIVIAVGNDQGLDPHWTAKLVRGTDPARFVSDVDITVVRIDKHTVTARVALPAREVAANPHAVFYPPP